MDTLSNKAEFWMAKLFRDASTPSAGQGVSSTKLVWLYDGLLAGWCASLMTVGGVSVYIFLGHADPIYWGATTGMWTIALGFANNVKNNQTQATKEITIASNEASKEITLASQQATGSGTKDEGGA